MLQHQVMIESVENHMPEDIVIDEIGNEQEANAARTIAERGVQLIGTAHGQTLENLMLNPSLCDLIGGIQTVTLSDDEAKRRGTQKTVLERKAPPTFDIVIELIDFDRLAVHHNVQKTVDLLLRGVAPRPEIRVRTDLGKVEVVQREDSPDLDEPGFNERFPSLGQRPPEPLHEPRRRPSDEDRPAARDRKPEKPKGNVIRIYPLGLPRTRLERAIRETKAPAYITSDLNQADAVIVLRTVHSQGPSKLKELDRNVPTVVIKSNSYSQIEKAVDEIVRGNVDGDDRIHMALEEAMAAIQQVLQNGKAIDLSPQDARVRKKQHQLIESKRLASESVGHDPERHLRVLPVKLI